MVVTPLELANIASVAADDKKADDLVCFDLTGISEIADYMVICSASSRPKLEAIVSEIEEKVRLNAQEKPLSTEGKDGGTWIVMDYGRVLVHVFETETREYYRLENLYADAPRVSFDLGSE